MNTYKEVRSIKEGLLINKDYYNYLKNYKEDKDLEKKLNNKEITLKDYKYINSIKEKKDLKDCSCEKKLIKWEDIKSWNTYGRIGHIKIIINVKNLKKDIEPNFVSNSNLLNSLEKYCFGKGKIDKNLSLKFARFYLYFVYFVIFIICLYMFISIIK